MRWQDGQLEKAGSRPGPQVTDDCWSTRAEQFTYNKTYHRTDVHLGVSLAQTAILSGYAFARGDVTAGARREWWRAMDQDRVLKMEASERAPADSLPAVASRRRAVKRFWTAVNEGQPGQVILMTGEPGAGKTWLASQLAGLLAPAWMTARVDLTGAMTALDFLQLVSYSVGTPLAGGIGEARARLHSLLHDNDVDGRRWLLLIDDAHRGSALVWDEIGAVVNQAGKRGGFAAVVVLGDTELARSMATHGFREFASTVRLHLHLPPLDVDEAGELLKFAGQVPIAADREIEELHREARGNAASLLRLARARRGFNLEAPPPDRWPRGPVVAEPRPVVTDPKRSARDEEPVMIESKHPAATPSVPAARAESLRSDSPSLVPAKPPIRVEEGLVEVGWDGDLEADFMEPADAEVPTEPLPTEEPSFNEELIDDPYAALQAWGEWAGGHLQAGNRSVKVETSPAPGRADKSSVTRSSASDEPGGSLEPSPAATPPPVVRAESQHEFAPYSQLFTRLRQSNQP